MGSFRFERRSAALARRWRIAVYAMAAVWLGLFLLRTEFAIDGDEAIVGVMATHIADARDFPLWFYGQNYMGSLEAWVAAPLVGLFGTHRIVLKLVAAFFWFVFLECSRRLATRIFRSEPTALVTVLLLACGPLFLTLWGSKLRGGYVSIWALGALTLLLAHHEGTERFSRVRSFSLGLVAGVAMFVNVLSLPYTASGVLFLVSRRRFFQPAPLGFRVLGFLLGAAPLIVFNLLREFATFRAVGEHAASADSVSHNFSQLITHALPVLLGGLAPWSLPPHYASNSPQACILVGYFFVALAALTWSERRSLTRFATLSRSPTSGVELYYAAAVILICGICVSKLGGEHEPRYASVLYVLIAPALAFPICQLLARGPTARITGAAVLLTLLISNASSIWQHNRRELTQPSHYVRMGVRMPLDAESLVRKLREARVDGVFGDYWLPSTVAYISRERIAADTFRMPWQFNRFFVAHRVAYLLQPSATNGPVMRAFRQAGRDGQLLVVEQEGTLAIAPTEVGLLPRSARVTASSPGADGAFDGSMGTWWRPPYADRASQSITIDLGSEQQLAGVFCFFGRNREPRRFFVERGDANGTFERIGEWNPATVWFEPLVGRRARYIRLGSPSVANRTWAAYEIRLFLGDR
jgi:hypothetical protein